MKVRGWCYEAPTTKALGWRCKAIGFRGSSKNRVRITRRLESRYSPIKRSVRFPPGNTSSVRLLAANYSHNVPAGEGIVTNRYREVKTNDTRRTTQDERPQNTQQPFLQESPHERPRIVGKTTPCSIAIVATRPNIRPRVFSRIRESLRLLNAPVSLR
jgi:hypothetical protein